MKMLEDARLFISIKCL